MHPAFAASGVSRLPIELIGEIIDYSLSPRDVVPWLTVSRQVHARAVNAASYSAVIWWPPLACSMIMPCSDGLKSMLRGGLATRPTGLTVSFQTGVTGDYVNAVLGLVRAHGLHKLVVLSLRFLDCFGADESVPQLTTALNVPAPRLRHLEIACSGRNADWDYLPNVDMFDGVAPQLRRLMISGLDVPMYRIRAFDGVKTLDVCSDLAFSSSDPTHCFLGGCSALNQLHLRLAGNVNSTAAAASLPPLQRRISALHHLQIDLTAQRNLALPLLHIFANQDMPSICAVADARGSAFPPGFVSAVTHTLTYPTGAGFELDLTYMRVCYALEPRHAFRFGVQGRFRVFAFNAGQPRCASQIASMGRELDAGKVLANLKHITCKMSIVPSLAALSSPEFSFPSLTSLCIDIDETSAFPNPGKQRMSALHVTELKFIVPRSRYDSFLAEGRDKSACSLLRTWVHVPFIRYSIVRSDV